MLGLKEVQEAVNEIIATKPFQEKKVFVVDIDVSKNRNINIRIDAFSGIAIDDCSLLSKEFKNRFDQDSENYELTVSSAGITNPFKVHQQYTKAIGAEIKIQTKEGKRIKGIVKKADSQTVTIEVLNKKEKSTNEQTICFDEIKTAKQVISF